MSRPIPWLLMAAAIAMPISALAEPVACPLLLPGARASEAPAGWKVVPPTAVRLADAGLMRGDPSRQAYLRGNDKQTRNGSSSVSEFAAGEEKWLWCGYADGSVQIARRLPDAATVCTVTHETVTGKVIVSIRTTCR